MVSKQAILDQAAALLGAGLGGWRNALRLSGVGLVPLAYHVVSDRHVPHVAHLHGYKNVAQFEAELDFLVRNFSPIDPESLPDVMAGTRPIARPSFLLTIDDGLREIRDVIAPLLLAKGIPAILFVNADFVDNKAMFFRHKASLLVDRLTDIDDARRRRAESVMQKYLPGVPLARAVLQVGHHEQDRLDETAAAIDLDIAAFLATERPYLTTPELQDLARSGFTIGAHSASHPHYGRLSPQEQLDETLGSIAFVRQRFDPKPLFFAFPFHDLDVRLSLFAQMKEAGVSASFGTHAFRGDRAAGNIQRLFADEPAHRLERLIAGKCGELMILRTMGKGEIARA